VLAQGLDSRAAHGGMSGVSLVLAQSDSLGAHDGVSSVESGAAPGLDSCCSRRDEFG